MSKEQSILDAILVESKSRTDDFRRGFEAGLSEARREFEGEVQKVSAAAVQEVLSELEKLEAFKGQVAVHAAGRQILRYKHSMQNGMCWNCGVRAPREESMYRLCAHCEPPTP